MYGNGAIATFSEEAYQIESRDKFDTVVESIRGSLDDVPEFYKQITVTFNPWNERHWLKETFFDDDAIYKDQTFAITTTFRCNEWLDKQDKERYESLLTTNPKRGRVVANGEWGVAEGLVFENVTTQEFDVTKTIQKVGQTVFGLDFGFTHDPTALISAILDEKNKKLYIFDEVYKTGLLNSDIYKEALKRDLEGAKIVADSASPQNIAELRRLGLRRITGVKKGKGSIMAGIEYLKEFEIIVHPRCENILEEFNTYAFKQDKTSGKYLNEPEDANNHAIDALRYAVNEFIGGRPQVKTIKNLGI